MSLLTYSVDKKLSSAQTRWLFVLFAFLSMITIGCIYSSLTLFLQEEVGLSPSTADIIYAVFSTWFLSGAIVGGFMGGRFGHRDSALIGAFLMFVGMCLIGYSPYVFWGVAICVVGISYYSPNSFVLLGQTFEVGDRKRSHAYLLMYLGMNTGVFAASCLAGYLARRHHFNMVFIGGACSIILATLLFLYIYSRLAFKPDSLCWIHNRKPLNKTWFLGVCATILAMVWLVKWFLLRPDLSNWTAWGLYGIVVIGAVIFSFLPNTSFNLTTRRRLRFLVMLLVVSIVFWMLYNLEFSVMMSYFDKGLDRHLGSWLVPTQAFSGLNPVFNLLVGFALYCLVKKYTFNFGTDIKIYIGVASAGVGFLIMSYAVKYQLNAEDLVPLGWVCLGYVFLCYAEILVGPLSFSLVGEYGAMPVQGMLIGLSQFTTGVAGAFTALMSKQANFDKVHTALGFNQVFHHAALYYGLLALCTGVFFLIIAKLLRWMFRVKVTHS